MKRYIISLLLILLFITALLPLVAFPATAQPDIWDGTVANGFAGGYGTQNDPYQIETGAQLAYLAQRVRNGLNSYQDQYFVLTRDICLNDETFSFDPDTGLVKVTDGENTAYLGTGIPGNSDGNSVIFDQTPAERGTWYLFRNALYTGEYTGTLNIWTPIGTNTLPFRGNFNSNGHTISGLFINKTNTTEGSNYQGLFGYVMGSAINDVIIENSYINGNDTVGGILASGIAHNCHFSGIVCGNSGVGGIMGSHGTSMTTITKCINEGIVFGSGNAGGIAGNASALENCQNYGSVFGTNSTGGLAGRSAYSIKNCHNYGSVTGGTETGGIVGRTSGDIQNCHNKGNITGNQYIGGIAGRTGYSGKKGITNECTNEGSVFGWVHTDSLVESNASMVGGIAGYCEANASILSCVNKGAIFGSDFVAGIAAIGNAENCGNENSVNGNNSVGGILGCGNAKNCHNIADISGNNHVGGILGNNGNETLSTANNCYNMGTVVGKEFVGGIIGTGCAEFSYNTGSVFAVNFAGGILGGDTSLHSNVKNGVYNCYNTGTVRGDANIGGVAGRGSVEYSYNAGTVQGKSEIGGVLGYLDSEYHVTSCYYLNTTAKTGVGNQTQDPQQIKALTDTQMKKASSFAGFIFDGIWAFGIIEGYEYPTLHNHIHVFDQQITSSEYMYQEGTCQKSFKYYYSCFCGQAGTLIFKTDQMGEHSFTDRFAWDALSHWHECTLCKQRENMEYHTFDEGTVTLLPTAKEHGEFVYKCTKCLYQVSIPLPAGMIPEITDPATPDLPTPIDPMPPSIDDIPSTPDTNKETNRGILNILYVAVGIVVGAIGFYAYITIKDITHKKKHKNK
ncbi:MAG: hypothetical protein E7616_06220 [Ruminococcaceae bacterium]|nr:hypothetical protein [Oscillospiraceae bacterium]